MSFRIKQDLYECNEGDVQYNDQYICMQLSSLNEIGIITRQCMLNLVLGCIDELTRVWMEILDTCIQTSFQLL